MGETFLFSIPVLFLLHYQQKPNNRSLLLSFINGSRPKGTIIRLLILEGYDLFFGAKLREDLQQRDTIYISQPKAKNSKINVYWTWFIQIVLFHSPTIIRHGTIIRLLLVRADEAQGKSLPNN